MARKKSVQTINETVEQALLRKATGYSYTQQETYKVKSAEYGENGKKLREDEKIEVVEVQKHVPAEYAAIALWLKARDPVRWGEAAATASVVRIIDDVPASGEGACNTMDCTDSL